MTIDLIPIGYLLKATAPLPSGMSIKGVDEICSLSGCISAPPDELLDSWAHNALCLFDTVASAERAAGRTDHNLDVYAYKLAPMAFARNDERATSLSDIPEFAGKRPDPDPIGGDFELLGFDCVQTEWDRTIAGFGCSPLSCNGMATRIAVNRHCLIAEFDAACEAARLFAREQPEPGTYYVVAVWRRRRPAAHT